MDKKKEKKINKQKQNDKQKDLDVPLVKLK